jgi:hypothetical protein
MVPSLATYTSRSASPSTSLISTPKPFSLGDPARHRLVAEHTAPLIDEERIGDAVEHLGAAVGTQIARAVAAVGVALEAEVHVVGDVQIEVAVAVDVAECTAGAPAGIGDPGFGRDLLEAPTALVAKQPIRAVVGDQEVEPAVAIGVAHADAHAVAWDAGSRVRRHVHEAPLAVLEQLVVGDGAGG